jgi:hypothetical protein
MILKVQLEIISTIRRSLQLVGQGIKSKTVHNGPCRNWGFPKGCKSYLSSTKVGECNSIGNGGSVVVINHEGNQWINFCLLPAGRKFYSLDTKQKITPDIIQDCEISYRQLYDIELYKNAYQILKSKSGNMTLGTDQETLDGVSIK